MRRISILGATGSVGAQTAQLIRHGGGREAFQVVALTGGRNIALLAEMAREFAAELAVTSEPDLLDDLRAALADTGTEVRAGADAIAEAAARPADWVMNAIIGAAGLVPSLRVLGQGATLALANKESMVCAGPLVLAAARASGARVLPVDSEHSAVFQALGDAPLRAVAQVIITASGGAFRDWPLEALAGATVAQASTHPNFAMGQRITIDSATMFNKAMEVIEARELFDLAPEQIEVVIQREQVIHALVSFTDGATIAHMGAPDMAHPIGYALNWPERAALPVERLDYTRLGQLTFAPACEIRYPALRLARGVMQTGGLAGAGFTAAKERALDAFLAGQIGFTRMAEVVERTLEMLARDNALGRPLSDLSAVLELDARARAVADDVAQRIAAVG